MKRKPPQPDATLPTKPGEMVFTSLAQARPEFLKATQALMAAVASGHTPKVQVMPVEELGPPPKGVPWGLLPRLLGLPVALITDLERRILGSPGLKLPPSGRNQARRHLLGSDTDQRTPDPKLVHRLALRGAAYLWSQPEGVEIRLHGPQETADTIQSDSPDFTELGQVMLALSAGWNLGFEVEFPELWRTEPGSFTVKVHRASEVTHMMFIAVKSVMRGFINAYIDLHGLPKKEGRALATVFHNAFRTLDRKILEIDFEPRSDRLLLLLDGVLRQHRPWLVQEDRWLVLGCLMETFEAIPPNKKSRSPDALRSRIKVMLVRAARRASLSK
jgi:hypothetical protein